MSSGVNGGNRTSHASFDILDIPPPPEMRPWPPTPPQRRLWPAVVLFLLTVITTLAMGSEYAISYAQNREPFSSDQNLFAAMAAPFEHPRLLLLGIPFSFTLLAFFLAHEMGHFYACKYYGIDATYPYFIPAPTFFGTFGAVIRIRSPITTLRALFDIGIAGPIAGFLVAVPAMAFGIAHSKIRSRRGRERADPLRQYSADANLHRTFPSRRGPGLAAASPGRARGLGGTFRDGAESVAALAARRRTHPLQPDEQASGADFDRARVGIACAGILHVERLVLVGRHSADFIAAVSASGAAGSLGAPRRRAQAFCACGACDFSFVFYALAYCELEAARGGPARTKAKQKLPR